MDTRKFFGVVPAMATPFAADERFDEVRARELIEWYIASGVQGISVAGSQGEFFALDESEHIKLIEIAAKTINGRVPLYAGSGGVTTRASIRLTQAAQALGANLAMIITPYFVQPTQDELLEHYVAVAKTTRLPVMLYNNPPRTGSNVLPPTLVRCMQAADNIVGIKDSSGDILRSRSNTCC
jgi:4-hydroxy-tetrahydrodipicolinate synthase